MNPPNQHHDPKIPPKLFSVDSRTIELFSKLDKAQFDELLRRKGRRRAAARGLRVREILLWGLYPDAVEELAESKGIEITPGMTKKEMIEKLLCL